MVPRCHQFSSVTLTSLSRSVFKAKKRTNCPEHLPDYVPSMAELWELSALLTSHIQSLMAAPRSPSTPSARYAPRYPTRLHKQLPFLWSCLSIPELHDVCSDFTFVDCPQGNRLWENSNFCPHYCSLFVFSVFILLLYPSCGAAARKKKKKKDNWHSLCAMERPGSFLLWFSIPTSLFASSLS